MLFTAPDNGNMSKDSQKYLHLCHQIKLKKLRRTLVLEEEIKRREAVHAKNGGGGTNNAGIVSGHAVDQADQLAAEVHDYDVTKEADGNEAMRAGGQSSAQIDDP
jgi:hypothetical protein